ncbi:anoctamin-7-like isoform X1 [Tachypleus tridentatus]|uniref:anoctamin-7-like isoform X1 n=3 Tax=Tachypleus tridentatus TaxID=6853 RepID=UPI003FD144E8
MAKSKKKWFSPYTFFRRSRRNKRNSPTGEHETTEEQLGLNTSDKSPATMPRFGHYSEKYELNGPQTSKGKDTYGSFNARDDDGDSEFIIQRDQLNEVEHSPSSEQGIIMAPTPADDKGTYFRDGKRKIDFVLVYEEPIGEAFNTQPAQKASKKAHKHEAWRKKFMSNLRKAGLDMEEEVVESEKKTIHFVKLSAPWTVLINYAEELCMRAPLQAHPNPSANWSEQLLGTFHIPNIMYEDVPNKPLDYYTCAFKKSKLDKFLGVDNQDEYFTSTQRARILYEILEASVYGKRRRAQIGINRLVEEGVYNAAFPLHDGLYQKPPHYVVPESLNNRQILYEYWARWGKWYKYQPLDHIREYFGEKIGIYFAWLGFYTGWLLPAAIVGLIVFMYGVFTINFDPVSNDVCSPNSTYKMCPRCDEKYGCAYWYLSDICLYSKLTYLFDHPGTVFYAIFVSFWAVTFLEYWKGKSASLAHHWDCMDFEEEEERPRPEFAAKAPSIERNPITGVKEPFFPTALRIKRMAAGIGALFLMLALIIIFIVAVIIYRVLVSIPLFQSKTFRGVASPIASSTGACVNLIFIMALGRVYETLALKLTQWEMHRTQTDFENNLTFKVFIFQFVNFYSSIFYIAFFKGRFVGYPGHYQHLLGLRNEDCNGSGCLSELAQQLAIIMVGKQIINNAQEILVPKLKAWWHKKKTKMEVRTTRWEEDYQLIDNEGLFQEYLEMVLQFGFITIFVAAFPLAPLFALLNNWVEIRLDAQKFVCETRRTVAERAQNIGVWFTILEFVAHLAVISNAFLIAFTSEFLPKLVYMYEYSWNLEGYVNFTLALAPNGTLTQECRYQDFRDTEGNHTMFYWHLLAVRLGFVIIFEHLVFAICRMIDIVVPDIPKALEVKIKRERYLAKQALADSETIMKVAQRRDEDDDDDGALSPPPDDDD